jgi:PAS domain S-box-containing protein
MDQRDDWRLTDAIEHQQGRGDPFAAAVRATRMPMVITDPNQGDNPIVYCNAAFQKLTGYERDEIIGRNCRFLLGADTDRDAVTRVRAAVESGHDIDVDLLNYRKDGSTFWNALYLSPVRDDDGRIRFFFASQLDVTDRVEAQRMIAEQKAIVEREVRARTGDLREALDAKTLLLHEVDHRVKNNLTMIGSLLRLQVRDIEDEGVRARLDAMLERVDALATVHRRLYQSDDISRFDVGAFTLNLVSDVLGSAGRTDVEVDAAVERVDVSAGKASSLGLVINEVVTNAVKHAYADGRPGRVRVEARRDGDRAIITVADDGPGMPPPSSGGADGLGSRLIRRLSRQVGAETAWSDASPGTRVTISLPVDG